MTDIAGFQGRTIPVTTAPDFPTAPLLTEKYWGFIVKSTAKVPVWLVGMQAISMVFGAGFAAATFGIWGLPSLAVQVDSFAMRTGLSIFFTVSSYLLISYANRGVASELQVDLGLGEVREVLRNRSGKSVLLAHYGFDAFKGMTIDRSSGIASEIRLILLHQDETRNLLVATGTEAEVGFLYGRLERDLLRQGGSRQFDAIEPKRL